MFSGENSYKPIISESFDEPSVISNVVEYFSNYINVKKVDEIDYDKIVLWAKFCNCDYNDPRYCSDKRIVVFLIGRRNGLEVYQLKTDGNLVLFFSLQTSSVPSASMLPSPLANLDSFSDHRPLLAVIFESDIKFYSLRSGDCVKTNNHTDNLLQVDATEWMIVASTHRDLLLICPKRLIVLCIVTNCMAALDPYAGVVYSLSDHWLAFADSHLSRDVLSVGGDVSEPGSVPYVVTMLSVKKMVISSLGSGDSVKNVSPDDQQGGVVTIVDLDRLVDYLSHTKSKEFDSHLHTHMVVAHFTAHLWTPVAKMVFDATGTLLLTACNQGLFCHLFRIAPHPTSCKQAAVLHLYRLKRGDTPCSIVSMSISKDARLASASSSHGTVHIWPISSYGGALCVRTHCQKHVVNRLSRLERSAGLQEHQVTRPRNSSGGLFQDGLPNHAYHSLCPRLPPMPIPLTINSYVQLKPISHIPPADFPLVLIPHFPLGEYSFAADHYIRLEPILVLSFDGRLIQYVLRHHPDVQHQPTSRTELDAPFIIEKQPMLQWKLMLSNIYNCTDKVFTNKRRTASNSHINLPVKSNSQSAMLPSVIPDFLNQSFQASISTPKCWYSHIEISSQISSTSNIRRQDKFSISTYQTKEPSEARLEVLEKSPSASSDLSIQSVHSENEKADIPKGYIGSMPVKVPYSEQRIQICNSFCGSSVSDSLGGSFGNMSSVLAHAILDEDDYMEPPPDIIEEPKTGYIEYMTHDIGHVRLRRVSGSFSSDNGRVISYPLEADILEELDIPTSPYGKHVKLSKRHDQKKGRRN